MFNIEFDNEVWDDKKQEIRHFFNPKDMTEELAEQRKWLAEIEKVINDGGD